MNILLLLFCLSFVMVISAIFKMGHFVLIKLGKEDFWNPAAVVIIIVEYVSYTKEEYGNVGIWFKILVLGFMLGIISGILMEFYL